MWSWLLQDGWLPARLGTWERAPSVFPQHSHRMPNSIMPPLSPSLCFVEKNLFFFIFHITSFFYPCFQVISNILHSNNPKSSRTWNFWSWRKSHWNKSTPTRILWEVWDTCLSEQSCLWQGSPPVQFGFVGIGESLAKSKEKEMYSSQEFSWFWTKDRP